MPGNTFGRIFRITTWGESHGKALGVVVDGCPAGVPLTEEDIQKELNRRRPGTSRVVSPRQEKDKVEILSGVFEGKTLGTPISMIIWNVDVDSSKYEPIKNVFRPGQADFTYWAKYGIRDWRGGGRASARETVGRVAGGAIAKKLLHRIGIKTTGYTLQVGKIRARDFDESVIENNDLRMPDLSAAKEAAEYVDQLRKEGDSTGCLVGIKVQGVPPGLGDPVFNKLDGDLAAALMSIGAVKGIEIGKGFGVVTEKGSSNNDPFIFEEGEIVTETNNAGGILGGITTGNEIVIRLAVKPTPSIRKRQKSVDSSGKEVHIEIQGRHDPVICPRIVPVAEAMINLVLIDHYLLQRAIKDFWNSP